METQYYMKSRRSGAEHCFSYDLNGNLIAFKSVGEPLTTKGWEWLLSPAIFPYNEARIQALQSHPILRKSIEIKAVPINITFEDFWNEYGKIGTKAVAKRKFEKLKPEEVIKAFIGIEKERTKKKLDNTAMPYAETYLNQKRWEV